MKLIVVVESNFFGTGWCENHGAKCKFLIQRSMQGYCILFNQYLQNKSSSFKCCPTCRAASFEETDRQKAWIKFKTKQLRDGMERK